MNDPDPEASTQAQEAIRQVLQAERDAEQAVRDCENEAQQTVHDAQARARRILARTDQRITNMEMRHGHKLDKIIKDIGREGSVELRLDASRQYDAAMLQDVIDAMAAELCQPVADPGDERKPGG